MRKAFTRSDSRIALLLGATAILAGAFAFPRAGRERTCYEGFGGLVLDLSPAKRAAQQVAAPAAGEIESLLERRLTPFELETVLAGFRRSGEQQLRALAERYERQSANQRAAAAAKAARTPAKPAPAASAPERRWVEIAALTRDGVREAYERELSRFALKAAAREAQVEFGLAGICRWEGGYIVKFSVSNAMGKDFFVKRLAVLDAGSPIAAKDFFQVFVSPAAAGEGYVVFPGPRPGAQVQIVLKEDGEKGRTLAVPVDYPF